MSATLSRPNLSGKLSRYPARIRNIVGGTIWWWPPIIRRYSGIYSRRTVEQILNFEGAKRRVFFPSLTPFRANLSGLGSGPVWISRHVPKSFNDAKLSLRGTVR